MRSDYHEPLNLGQDRLISINRSSLRQTWSPKSRGVVVIERHVTGALKGVRGRNSTITPDLDKGRDWDLPASETWKSGWNGHTAGWGSPSQIGIEAEARRTC